VGTVAATVAEAAFALLLGCSRFRAFGVTGAAAPWVYAAVLAVFWQAGTLTVAAAALIWAITNLVTGVASAAVALRVTGIARPDWPLLDRSIRYGLRAWTGSLARFLNFRSDQLLVSFLAGEAVLGVYAVAVNASEVLLYLPAAIFTTLIPLAAESAAPERLQTTLQAFRLLAITTFASIAVAALAAPPLLPLVFGEAYDGSVEPFLLLLPGAIGFAMLGIFSSALLAAAAPGRSSLGTIVALVVGLVLDLALIPPYGASGAALAASVAFLLGGVVAMIALRRIEPFGLGELWPRVSDVRAFGRFVRGRTFQR